MIKSKHPLYPIWSSMHARCSNPNNHAYHRYGGRGIKVCDAWLDFWQFARDMGDRPEKHSIDRIDNDKGYSKENCRWADTKTQMRNTSDNRWIMANGEIKVLKDWALETGLSEQVIHKRINKHGWSYEDAVNTPVNGSRKTAYTGSKNGKAKLDEWSVMWIKRMLKAGNTGRYLAEVFGVHESAISAIKMGQKWSHVEV